MDAAILFADITTPLPGIGVEVELVDGVGPVIERPIRTAATSRRLRPFDPTASVGPLLEAIALLRAGSPVPVIGFAGAPFTLAAYLIEGRSPRELTPTKSMIHAEPATWDALLGRLVDMDIAYLAAPGRRRGAGRPGLRLVGRSTVARSTTDGRCCRTCAACSMGCPSSASRSSTSGPGRPGCSRRWPRPAATRSASTGASSSTSGRRRVGERAGPGQPRSAPAPRSVAATAEQARWVLDRGGRSDRSRLQSRARRAARHRSGRPAPPGRPRPRARAGRSMSGTDAMTGAARLLAACRGEPVDATPVWFMRQSGGSLPAYLALRERHSVLEIARDSGPVRRGDASGRADALGTDGAVLFADVMLPVEAMGVALTLTGRRSGPRPADPHGRGRGAPSTGGCRGRPRVRVRCDRPLPRGARGARGRHRPGGWTRSPWPRTSSRADRRATS